MAPPSSRPGSSARPNSSGVPYHHGANGKAAVVSGAKMPGTPRREQSHRLEKAVQDPGLKDYVGLSGLSLFLLLLLRPATVSAPSAVLHPFPPPDPLAVSFPSTGSGVLCGQMDGACTARPYIPCMHALPGLHMHLPFVRWLGGRPFLCSG